MATTSNVLVFRKSSRVGIVIGLVVLMGIGLPGVVMQPSSGTVGVFVVAALLAFGLVCAWSWRVECHHDPEARTLRVVTARWPLPHRERVLPFSTIERVLVSDNARWIWIDLVLTDSAFIALPGEGAATPERVRESARVLRGWIGTE